MEDYILIVVAMKAAVDENPPLGSLLDNLIAATEREIEKLTEVVDSCPMDEVKNVISLLPSTGGKPAYNIAKEQIEQLRETGLKWCSIEELLGVLSPSTTKNRIRNSANFLRNFRSSVIINLIAAIERNQKASFSISLSIAAIKLSSKLPNDGFGTVFSSTAAFIATTIRM